MSALPLHVESSKPVMVVSDYPRAKAFYESLGFQENWAYGEPVVYGCIGLGEESALHGTFHLSVAPDSPSRGKCKAQVFIKTDIEGYYAALKAAGVKMGMELTAQPYHMKDFFVNDPDGNHIGFGQPLMD